MKRKVEAIHIWPKLADLRAALTTCALGLLLSACQTDPIAWALQKVPTLSGENQSPDRSTRQQDQNHNQISNRSTPASGENTVVAARSPTAGTRDHDAKKSPSSTAIDISKLKLIIESSLQATQIPIRMAEHQIEATRIGSVGTPLLVLEATYPGRTFFDFDKDEMREDSLPVLNDLARVLRDEAPDARVTVVGHTDARGTDEYNLRLARRRSISVIKALAKRGISPERLHAVAAGKRQPIAPNATDEGRSLNRRVEFMISSNFNANLAAITDRTINTAFLLTGTDAPVTELVPASIELLTYEDAVANKKATNIGLKARVMLVNFKEFQPIYVNFKTPRVE